MDNNGSVDYEEWITAALDKSRILNPQNIRGVFKLLGGNKDGYLEVEDFKSKMPARDSNNMRPENSKGEKLVAHD